MTIQRALDLADQMKPNMMQDETKIQFLSELEGIIFDELLMQHEHLLEEERNRIYDADTDRGTEMLAPAPYDMVYVYWLMGKIDLQNMEIDKYNNDTALFNTAYETLSDWWTRNKMPIQKTREFRL